ncbi:MAG: hypothetical protein WCR95_01070 [Eubacteriales bacterium]
MKKPLIITNTSHAVIREKLKGPFGFKGRYIDELWQVLSRVSTENHTSVTPSTQSVLWSDSRVFAEHTPDESNGLMYKVTQRALGEITGKTLTRPDFLIDEILPGLLEYADFICGRKVSETFVLNSLVGLDISLWSLFAEENGACSFDDIIPDSAKNALSANNRRLAHIPLISYNVDEKAIKSILSSGSGLLKIKIGATVNNTSRDTDMKTMLEWDKKRVLDIHLLSDGHETSLTKSGRVCYYLDANGRYDTKERLWELLDFLDKKDILKYVALIEEPFPEEDGSDVSDFPVNLAADESAHSVADLQNRLSLGYRCATLKPVAKTLSMSFKMAEAVSKAGGECLCADLTVNPFLACWNKLFACRLKPLELMNAGCVEVNGNQNYKNWEEQIALLPKGLDYTRETNGYFDCGGGFSRHSKLLFGENGYFKFV